MTEYMVRFAHQCGVGLDPYKDRPGRLGKKWLRYWKCGMWYGGPETATRFSSLETAEEIIDKYGHRKAEGSGWLGHCEPCEIVTVEQAFEDEEKS